MTIVSGPDHRNADWANNTSNFGQKMLLKMGWSKGKGLGKNEQGTNDNLRAIRREEGLGIGAKTDTLGEEGFSSTSRNFHGVLATLREQHGDTSSSKKKSKKSKKKSKEKKKDDTSSSSGLTLSTKRVTAGHAAKMRDAKNLTNKSKEDMAAIFGMKVQDYQTNSVWGKLSSLSSSNNTSEAEEEKPETTRTEKKRKRKKELSDVDTNASTDDIKTQEKDKKKKDKKKRKRTEESSSSSSSDEVKKKKKKKKSKA